MIIVFDKHELQVLYEKGYSENRRVRFQPSVIKQYIKIINMMHAIEKLEELYQIKSLHIDNFKEIISDQASSIIIFS